MLDQKIFLKGIKYLNAYYTNFNFNINDDLKLKVWYDVFSSFTDDDFTHLIKTYCVQNIYPPQSPSSVLEYAKTQLKLKYMDSSSAWDYAISILRHVGYDFSRFYSKCEYSIISTIIKSLRTDLEGIHTDKLPFVKKTFVAMYDEAIDRDAQIKTKEGLWITQVSSAKALLKG